MTTVRDNQHLDRLQLLVLARLSCATRLNDKKISEDIAGLASPDDLALHTTQVHSVLSKLREDKLVFGKSLTELGSRMLRTAFKLDKTPTWREVVDSHLPALALGLRAGSAETRRTMKLAKTIHPKVIQLHFGTPTAKKLDELADTMIAQALGMPPGPVTITQIRLHMLAQHVGAAARGDLDQARAAIARQILQIPKSDKNSMDRALGRRWLYQITHATTVSSGQPAHLSLPIQTALSLPRSPKSQPASTPTESLLEVVREALPRIGADGRFGTEKVFVSAIWQRIERDRHFPDLSLDRFKSWLITANRDQLLDLARADLVAAMDPRLVRESEIEDRGATFHFVLDRRTGASGSERHAR